MATVPGFIYLPKKVKKAAKQPESNVDSYVVQHLPSGTSPEEFAEIIFETSGTAPGSVPGYLTIKTRSFPDASDPAQANYWIQWQNNAGDWFLYSDEQSRRSIWMAWTQDNATVCLDIKSVKYPDGQQYVINLKSLQQTNATTGRHRPVKISVVMKVPTSQLAPLEGDETARLSEARSLAWSEETKYLKHRRIDMLLHELLLKRLITPECIIQAISEDIKPLTLLSMVPNINLQTIASDLWDRFVDSFDEELGNIPNYKGHLWRFALNPEGPHHRANPLVTTNADSIWTFAFCPIFHDDDADEFMKFGIQARAARIGSYCEARPDLDQDRSWFGLTSSVTEFYCKPHSVDGVVSMAVFLVLMPRGFDYAQERMVQARRTIDNLPVALITLSGAELDFPGPACSLWEEMNEGTLSSEVNSPHVTQSGSGGLIQKWKYTVKNHVTTSRSSRKGSRS